MDAPGVASAAVVAAGSEQNEVVRQLLQEVLRQLPAPNELRALDHASYAMLELVQRKRLRDPERRWGARVQLEGFFGLLKYRQSLRGCILAYPRYVEVWSVVRAF